jgi:hypothetical protein
MVFIAIADLSHCVRLWRKLSTNCGRKPNTAGMRTSCLPRRLSEGKRPLWGQTINARFVKPAAVALGLVSESESFGWHRFRHSQSWREKQVRGNRQLIPANFFRSNQNSDRAAKRSNCGGRITTRKVRTVR